MSNGGSKTTPGSGGYFNSETSNSLPYTASATANTFSGSNTCAQTSVAPVISPASGSSSGSQTVTFTNPGQNRDTNTGIWYTTDGTNPVPGAGTAKYISSGGSITVGAATVKAVGMWGAANQPTSYASGYGYVPSAVVSAVYIGNLSVSAKTVVSGYLRPKSGANTMTAGSTMQMTAYVTYSDGSTGTLPDAQGNVVTCVEYHQPWGGQNQQPGSCYGIGGGFDKYGGHGWCPEVDLVGSKRGRRRGSRSPVRSRCCDRGQLCC